MFAPSNWNIGWAQHFGDRHGAQPSIAISNVLCPTRLQLLSEAYAKFLENMDVSEINKEALWTRRLKSTVNGRSRLTEA